MPKFTRRGNAPLLRIYSYYRLGLACVLLLIFSLDFADDILGKHQPVFFLLTLLIYIALALLIWPLLKRKSYEMSQQQTFALLAMDALILVTLIHTSGGLDSGLSTILFVTLATGGVTLNPRASAAIAAVTTLLVLLDTLFLLQQDIGSSQTLFSAGILGVMLFLCSLGFSYLGLKLRESTETAIIQRQHLRHLQELAQMIIERMQTGIVVTDPDGEVQLINRSASRLLHWPAGHNGSRRLEDIPALEENLSFWLKYPQSRIPNLTIDDSHSEIRVRFARLSSPQKGSELEPSETLIYVEDTRAINREAQKLKLASLGRLTASIAHEIRNPLGSLSHASQLLAESTSLPAQDQRLLQIIQTNSSRINQIIENVLQLSRRKPAKPEVINLSEWLPGFIRDYLLDKPDSVIDLIIAGGQPETRIDTSQLSQVLTNLFDNGLRYSERATGTAEITVRSNVDDNRELAFIEVIDEGDGIAEENLTHIFEPFFTTELSGSGLGLYLCRELCEINHATLNFRRTADGKSCFRIDLAHPDRIF